MTPEPLSPVVFTNKARCRDCYRCLRACPVKAIRMKAGQAQVVEAECIACGTCVHECPQGAKHVRSDVERVAALLASGVRVAASVAPSFAGVFPESDWRRLPSVLRRLGFAHISETAVAATTVARQTREHTQARPTAAHLTSCCPAVVGYVERRYPALVGALVPLESPMIAHARHLKAKLGPDWQVVFIGPCVAKKLEAAKPEHAGAVDAVLTFQELADWLERTGITPAGSEESAFDEAPCGDARYFPLPGGLARAATTSTDLLARETLAVAGRDALDALCAELLPDAAVVIEPLFCQEGCVGGPATPPGGRLFQRRASLLHYVASAPHAPASVCATAGATAFTPQGATLTLTEDQIRGELDRTGRATAEDQLNCGACGYASCRDKAIAVLLGKAEHEMCVPRMRRLAEQRTDKIIETTPNGVLILDRDLCILAMNPAFRRLFACGDAVLGRQVAYLMDPAPFERVVRGEAEIVEVTVNHQSYGRVCHELIYPLQAESQVVAIFVDVTQTREARERLERLRSETLSRARELLEHQVRTAQRIASLLGESTAESETLVTRLLDLAAGEADPTRRRAPWDNSP